RVAPQVVVVAREVDDVMAAFARISGDAGLPHVDGGREVVPVLPHLTAEHAREEFRRDVRTGDARHTRGIGASRIPEVRPGGRAVRAAKGDALARDADHGNPVDAGEVDDVVPALAGDG